MDFGLLILRVGLGIAFIMHGFPKLQGGAQVWEGIGKAMSNVGINFGFQFFGLMAALSEFLGGILLILGLFVRPASLFMFITMLVASLMHIKMGQDFGKSSHAIELTIVFLSLFLIGPGGYNFDFIIKKKAKS